MEKKVRAKRYVEGKDRFEIRETAVSPEAARFAESLSELMVERQISQQDINRALGLSPNAATANSYAAGKSIPPLDRALKIAKLFDVDVLQLLTGIPAPFQATSEQLGLGPDAVRNLVAIATDEYHTEKAADLKGRTAVDIIIGSRHFREIALLTLRAMLSGDEFDFDVRAYKAQQALGRVFDDLRAEIFPPRPETGPVDAAEWRDLLQAVRDRPGSGEEQSR